MQNNSDHKENNGSPKTVAFDNCSLKNACSAPLSCGRCVRTTNAETPSNTRRNHLPGKSKITHTPTFNWTTKWPTCSPNTLPSLNLLERDRSKMPEQAGRPISDLVTLSDNTLLTAPPVANNTSMKMCDNSSSVKMLISGVTIEFPHDAYPVQKYMMCQIVSAIKTAKHCLLESPTGTGKTLALLCSALAWQQQEAELLRELKATSSSTNNEKPYPVAGKSTPSLKTKQPKPHIVATVTISDSEDETDDDEIFRSPKRKKRSEDVKEFPEKLSQMNIASDKMDICNETTITDPLNVVEEIESIKPPKIYYGARTHRQIAQVVDQLKKTVYGDKVRMTILASRDHTCVNNEVCTQPNITEHCRTLIDPMHGHGCSYYTGATKVNHQSLQACQLPVVFDIEDIMKVGKRHKVCPYFSLRNLVLQSDIIFCPYNYLIDPTIRESMNINLAKSVVIMDEAHNIEEACRETGSLWLRQGELLDAIAECTDNITNGANRQEYGCIKDFLVMLENWLSENGSSADYMLGSESRTAFSGEDLTIQLDINGITQEKFQQMKDSVSQINHSQMDNPDSIDRLSSKVKLITSSISSVFNYVFKPENSRRYQAYFMREVSQKKPPPTASWLSSHRKNESNREWHFTLHVTCLSPATVFSELLLARTIILASGTLSPLDTFQSELEVKFPHVVKGWHVVPKENLFVSVVESGPHRVDLKGIFKNTSTYEYQDELGRAILETAKAVPHGVLCFFQSYFLMEKLRDRWQSTGLLDELTTVKELFWEPRSKEEMSQTMTNFNSRIERSVVGEIGALMFGVFRGKIAEGIDFSDANARAVIAVGIPFMNMQTKEISLKMKYNDETTTRKLLPGKRWYKIQAYRALNQALGRCIRHKKDWGAVVLMDLRMCNPEAHSFLPRWIRQELRLFTTWDNYIRPLSAFCQNMEKLQQVQDTTL